MESSVTCVNEMSLNRWQMTRTFVGRKVKCMTNQRRKQKIKRFAMAKTHCCYVKRPKILKILVLLLWRADFLHLLGGSLYFPPPLDSSLDFPPFSSGGRGVYLLISLSPSLSVFFPCSLSHHK